MRDRHRGGIGPICSYPALSLLVDAFSHGCGSLVILSAPCEVKVIRISRNNKLLDDDPSLLTWTHQQTSPFGTKTLPPSESNKEPALFTKTLSVKPVVYHQGENGAPAVMLNGLYLNAFHPALGRGFPRCCKPPATSCPLRTQKTWEAGAERD